MGEENSISGIYTSTFPPPTTLTIILTTVYVVSPTFQGIINEPITSLFSYQSTDQDTLNNEDEEDEMVEFAKLEIDHEEENVDDNAIMLGKHYKILNSKLNPIL
ncbi:unnamed protein product [Lactuca saligna]|uniref:Uncharacterized protein n=1 Tax=Lactuca saligna TaxID=75948 RepID=A0AA36E3L3_LACSI|nr:unnamed protein product [Lactuca saligna]